MTSSNDWSPVCTSRIDLRTTAVLRHLACDRAPYPSEPYTLSCAFGAFFGARGGIGDGLATRASAGYRGKNLSGPGCLARLVHAHSFSR